MVFRRLLEKFSIHCSYGITLEEYNKKLSAQNYKCAICDKHKSNNVRDKRNNKIRYLSVDHCHKTLDHCHKTLKIRSLSCYPHNLALSILNDNIDVSKCLVEYLEHYEKETSI